VIEVIGQMYGLSANLDFNITSYSKLSHTTPRERDSIPGTEGDSPSDFASHNL
jgi:hypothetical protein